MSRFDNIKCPVCSREFAEGDDIVVCPDCGTPHHRECYNYVGRCVNQGLHKSNYSFSDEHRPIVEKAKEEAEKNAPVGTFFISANTAQPQGENMSPPVMPFGALPELTPEFEADADTIDGESVSDFAATVRSNVSRFITIFKRLDKNNKKLSWNWGAFFFGSLYFFFRKIYKQAVSLISLFVLLLLGADFAISKLAPKSVEILQEVILLASQNDANGANAKMLEVIKASDYKNVQLVMGIFLISVFVLRIIEALFADYIYKNAVSSIIKRVRVQLDEGASFSSPMANMNEMDLTQEQMKKFYLASKGGVNIFAPLMAFLLVEMLLNVF